MNRSLLFSIASAFLFFGCSPDEYLVLPIPSQKISVFSIQQNGRPWLIRVAKSNPIHSNSAVSGDANARVLVSENKGTAIPLTCTNPQGEGASKFASNLFQPVAGHRYDLTVEVEGYPALSSYYYAPFGVEIDSLTVSTLQRTNGFVKADFRVIFDDPDSLNFYEFYIKASDKAVDDGSADNFYFKVQLVNPAYKENESGLGVLLSDKYFNGQRVVLDFTAELPPYFASKNYQYFTIFLRNLTAANYIFLKELDLLGNALQDPYGQPVQIDGNIENGLGVFTGYAQTELTVKLSR